MRKLFLFVTVLVSVFIILPLSLGDDGEEIELYLGEMKTIPVSNPTRLAIGKPNIADVTNVTNQGVTLTPKALGTTKLIVWDNFGEQSFKLRVLSEDMHSIKQRVDTLIKELNLPKVYTKAADTEEKILLLGEVKTSQDRERILTALGLLKDKTVDLIKVKEEEATVEIAVEILEINKDATDTLGLTNPLSSTSGLALTEVGSSSISTAGAKWSNLFRVTNLTHNAFSWTLYALVQEGKARILSRPRLACQSGKEAELLVGGEKPIFTTEVSEGGSGTEVEYKEYGIKLKIKPTVTEEKKIKLALNVEVSEVGAAEFIGLTTNRTAQAYPLTKRNASTELFLNDGQTMAIGGLMKQKSEEDLTKTPWLADIPVLGMFFRKRVSKTGGGSGERGNVELFITLTPTIVSEEKPAVKVVPPPEKIILPKAQAVSGKIKADPTVADYAKLVQAKIFKVAYYPKPAEDAGWEGIVKMSLNISSNGQLKEARITQSSGYKVLDDAAQEIANKQAPYPPFPPQIDSQELWVEVPIAYKKH